MRFGFYTGLFFWHWMLGYLHMEGIGNPEKIAWDAIIAAFDELFKATGETAAGWWEVTKLIIFISSAVDTILTIFFKRLAIFTAIVGFIVGILTNVFLIVGIFIFFGGMLFCMWLDSQYTEEYF